MVRSFRKERLNERIKELISELVSNRIKDPRIGLVTITSVSVTPDFATAKVYFTVMGDETVRSETRKGLESAKNYLRMAVGRELKLRQSPELRFAYDETLDRAMRIGEVIDGMRRKENLGKGEQEDDAENPQGGGDEDESEEEEDEEDEEEDEDEEGTKKDGEDKGGEDDEDQEHYRGR